MEIKLLTGIAPENKLYKKLKEEIKDAKDITMAVSFIKKAGLKKHLEKPFKQLLKNGKIKIYTSGYLRITEPKALEELLKLSKSHNNLDIFFNPKDRFHAKFIFIEKRRGHYSLFLGSSNISVGGLEGIGELNILLKGKKGDEINKDIKVCIENLEKDNNFKKINNEMISKYEVA